VGGIAQSEIALRSQRGGGAISARLITIVSGWGAPMVHCWERQATMEAQERTDRTSTLTSGVRPYSWKRRVTSDSE
jgi:hypothetical protein